MKLNIRGEKQKITDAMKDYAEEKLEKLEKYIKDNESITGYVLFKVNGPRQKIEITIPLKNFTLRIEESGDDFYALIDTATDKLERQIRKNKSKLESKRYKEKKDFVLDFIDEKYEEDKIVRRKQMDYKPMDEDEAIIQMELLGHDFFLYRDIDTDKVSLIYKRKDGNYGLIEES